MGTPCADEMKMVNSWTCCSNLAINFPFCVCVCVLFWGTSYRYQFTTALICWYTMWSVEVSRKMTGVFIFVLCLLFFFFVVGIFV